ncbi:tetratricopeptide repeat protein 28-like [Oculina patagonica]
MKNANRAGEATCYVGLGRVFQSLGDYVGAKEYLEKALAINMEIANKAGEAACYVSLGNRFWSLGDYVGAEEYLEKALVIKLEIGDRGGEAACYMSLGNVFRSLGDYFTAKEYHEKALAINMEIANRKGEAICYGNLGYVFQSRGDCVKAKEYHEKALTINMKIGNRKGETTCYGNLGEVFRFLGDYVRAKEYLEKALEINIEIGDRADEAACYGSLGNVFYSLGECVKAEEYLKKALTINKEIGDRAREATYYLILGKVFLALRQYKKSKNYSEKALATSMEIFDRAGEAVSYTNLGLVFQSLGDNVKAKEYYEKALAIKIEIGDRNGEAENYQQLGSVFLSLDKCNMAKEYLEKALSISKDIRHGEIEFRCYCDLTLLKVSQDKFHEAFSYLFQGIEKCEDLRAFNADNEQIKISFADKHVFPYQVLSALFCNTGDPNGALYVAELGRARALADLMATQYSAETHISANPKSWIGIENVMRKENNCTCLYISYYNQRVFLWILKTNGVISFRTITVDKNTLHKRLAQPAENLDEFFAFMAKSFRSFGILPDEVCEDRSLSDIEPNESDSSQEERLAAFRHAKGGEDPVLSLTLFHEMLILPVFDLLREEPEIIVVPDRNLYRVPFAALLDKNGKYLSETFRIRIIPSLTTLKLIQDSPADYHSQTGALIVGDPDVGDVIYCGSLNRKFVPLPGAREEAEMIGRLLGAQPLLGKEATKQAVLQRIASVSLIHFAAHGNAKRGEIALSPPSSTTGIPQEDDYLLKMLDISQVQLQAKLVVLSCCHSGKGQIRAEGVVGIARAFLGSGARSVLAALWALEDRATKQFMSHFYEHLVRRESASESLHKAMRWMRGKSFTEVSDWAPFMLIGDDVTFDFGK